MIKSIFLVCFLFLFSCIIHAAEKPAVIVLTDIGGDTDDEQSMVRLLLYSDVLDIKAICATSRLGHGQDTKPDIIQKQIGAYKKVYSNLILHSIGYPSPEYLASIVKNGQGDQFNYGKGYDTEASDYIIKVIDESERIVHIAVWGGQKELAQALWKVKNTKTNEEVVAFCKKIQVHAIGDQDKHRDWILANFKDIRYIANGFVFTGNFGIREISAFRGMYMTGDISLQNGDWVRKNIYGHGSLGECYQLNGHGTDGMKEGDSPSFLGLIENGLNIPEKPEWGGWGGRFRHLNNKLFIDAQDFLDGSLNERHTVSRWRIAFQRDFMARLDWCSVPYSGANHNPIASVNGNAGKLAIEIEAKGGDKLVFDASGSRDPDGNKLSFNWFVYDEISHVKCMEIKEQSGGRKCSIIIPKGMNGSDIQLIMEVSDNGAPSLTTYKRIIIHVN